MDNTKVHDTRLNNLNNQSIVHRFLNDRLQKSQQTTEEDHQSSLTPSALPKRQMPTYRFIFGKYHIGESVQYDVQLIETFKVFKKNKSIKYLFKTRFSKLEKLSGKLGLQGFPPKKIFGNKNEEFIQKRKQQLEQYLNLAVQKRCPEINTFIKQIKSANFIAEAKKPFALE